MPMTCCVVDFFDVFRQNNHHGSKRVEGVGDVCRSAGLPDGLLFAFLPASADFTGSSIEPHHPHAQARNTLACMHSLCSGGRGLFSDRFHSSPRGANCCGYCSRITISQQWRPMVLVLVTPFTPTAGAAGGRTGGPYETPCSNSNPGRKLVNKI